MFQQWVMKFQNTIAMSSLCHRNLVNNDERTISATSIAEEGRGRVENGRWYAPRIYIRKMCLQ